MQTLDKILKKLLASSADPKKISLTLKGILLAAAPIIIATTNLNADQYTVIVNGLVDITFYGTALASAFSMVFGLVRKIQLGKWSATED